MSPRQSVDRERMREFLTQLGRRLGASAKIYLVGGTSLVFEQLREQTLHIDVVLDVSPKDHGSLIRTIRDLKDELSVNVEEASPGDFIPLPPGHANRHKFIERFGRIDVFHFDLYSTALSKIERGRTQDLEDVLALLRSERIEWSRLVEYFEAILPKMGELSLRQDPVEFERNFRALEGMWSSGG